MAAVRDLGFDWGISGHPRRVFACVYRYAKFGFDRCNSFNKSSQSQLERVHRYTLTEIGLARFICYYEGWSKSFEPNLCTEEIH